MPDGPPWRRLTQLLDYQQKARIFDVIGYEPHPGQEPVHASGSRMRIVCCGRRFGKSVAAACEAVVVAALGGRVWAVAPDYDLASIVFDEAVSRVTGSALRSLLAAEPRTAKGSQLLSLKTGGWIAAKSSIKPKSLLGRGLDLVVNDEMAHEPDPEVWYQFLRPALTDRIGGLLGISTPHGDNLFKELFERGQGAHSAYASWQFPSAENPHILSSEIEDARRELPDDIFRQEYLAEFIDAVGAVFRGYRELCTLEPEEANDGVGPFVIGVDLARYQDWTVITVMNARTGGVVYVERFNNIGWREQIARIVELARVWRAPVLLDSTGLGDPVLEFAREQLPELPVEGYVFTNLSKGVAMNQLAVAIQNAEVGLLSPGTAIGRTVMSEIGAYQYERTEGGNLKMSAPKGRHDDCVVSLALAYECALRFGGFVPPRQARRPDALPELPSLKGAFGSTGRKKKPRLASGAFGSRKR